MDKRWTKAMQIAEMIRDLHLSRLSRCAQDCAETQRKITQLDPVGAIDPELSLAVQAETALRHKLWADRRRMELNELLARQTARKLVAEGEAQKAFGRSDALRRTLDKAGRKALKKP